MLTRKQFELLRFIHERLTEAGVPPSFDEMKEALDLKSKSGIHRLITALEERGFVRRLPHRARAMEIVRLPESVPQGLTARARGFSPSVIEGSLGRVPQVAEGESLPQTVAVPVMGRIAAGVPIAVAVLSYAGTLYLTATAPRDLDLHPFAAGAGRAAGRLVGPVHGPAG